jgi:predicted CoA-binding protein
MSDPRAVLEGARTVAVVGCSTDPGKAAHRIPAQLQAAGYRVIPVHPQADEILGERAYRTLGEIPEAVDLVDVFRPPAEAPEVARQAVAIGAEALWLQLGIRSPEARSIAAEAGLVYVEDRCTGADVRWFGITKS